MISTNKNNMIIEDSQNEEYFELDKEQDKQGGECQQYEEICYRKFQQDKNLQNEDYFQVDNFQEQDNQGGEYQQHEEICYRKFQSDAQSLIVSSDYKLFMQQFMLKPPICTEKILKKHTNCIQKFLNYFQKQMNILSNDDPEIKNSLSLLFKDSVGQNKRTKRFGLKEIKQIIDDERLLVLKSQFEIYMSGDAYNLIKSNKKLNENEQQYMECILQKIKLEIPKGKDAFKSFSSQKTNIQPYIQQQIDITYQRLNIYRDCIQLLKKIIQKAKDICI